MAVKRKPLSEATKATLRRKAMGRVNSFLRGSRKHDLDLRKRKRK